MADHSGWDAGNVYSSNQQLATDPNAAADPGGDGMEALLAPSLARRQFREFVRTFRAGNKFIYREQLLSHFRKDVNTLEIDLAHLNAFDARMRLAAETSEPIPLKRQRGKR